MKDEDRFLRKILKNVKNGAHLRKKDLGHEPISRCKDPDDDEKTISDTIYYVLRNPARVNACLNACSGLEYPVEQMAEYEKESERLMDLCVESQKRISELEDRLLMSTQENIHLKDFMGDLVSQNEKLKK